ncbi:MAG: 30S ribosomal protein S20 [Spirochaetes bacterium]|nr:30S ribosomal protein S20 [Spirochaetota bacterium]
MANIRSQIKRNRQNEKRRARNVQVKSSIRTAAKKVEKAVAAAGSENPETMQKLYVKFVKTIDKAAGAGVVHKKTAARKKSRVAKRVNAALKPKA